MESRRNHHISFDKNSSIRIINENPIFYNRHRDIDFSHSKLMQYQRYYSGREGQWRHYITSAATHNAGSLSLSLSLTKCSILILPGKQYLRGGWGRQCDNFRKFRGGRSSKWTKVPDWPTRRCLLLFLWRRSRSVIRFRNLSGRLIFHRKWYHRREAASGDLIISLLSLFHNINPFFHVIIFKIDLMT